MPELPSATTRVDEQAGTVAAGVNYIAVFAPVALNADAKPRVFSSHLALLMQHGYSPGADYVALHLEETKKPVLFLGLPIATPGAIVGTPVIAGNTGTSVVSLTAAAVGVLEETDGVVVVLKGGTVGTSQIMLGISLDGGRTVKPTRLGLANSYTIPYIGLTLAFGAGTLVTGDTVITWHTSAPRADQAGIQAARLALAAQQKAARSWLIIGDMLVEDDAADVVAQANAYETANDRFIYVRVNTRDRTALETKTQWGTAMDAAFGDVADEKRIDIARGRARKMSPILGYRFRRPAAWAVSIREYQHDVHVATWAKELGPLKGWDLEDADNTLVEFDERIDGGGLAGNFTCLRTWSNGPPGAFVALSLTRAVEGSLLSRTHNLAVANVACSVVQAETERAIGRFLVLNDDGTASAESLVDIEECVNSALEIALLQDKGEGPRASKAVWRASKSDKLNVPSPSLTGALALLLGSTLEHIATTVRIQTAG